MPSNLFESICAMLNRDGGDIILGVDDNGNLLGIDESKLEAIKTNIVNLSNNPEKLDPTFILFPQIHQIDGKHIIHIPVSVSSQVHKTGNFVFDRSNDGDFKVTNPERIAEIVLNKRTHYSEIEVIPNLEFSNFVPEVFEKARNLIKSYNNLHPWLELDDEQMLKKAGLWRLDRTTSKEGYTLAAALLFGKEEVIKSLLPYYKIDLIVRKDNIYRYDDRDYIECNLVEAYDRIMDFISKHLPDTFYMEGDQRQSIRTKIFREIAANIIIHREYRNSTPTILVIHNDKVETQNANNPNGEGLLLPETFTPFPKNPLIAKFFVQLGRVDELGSGIMNVNRLINSYAPNRKPQFIEGQVFKTIIPVGKESSGGINDGINQRVVKTIIQAIDKTFSDEYLSNLTSYIMKVANNEGKRTVEYSKILRVSERSIERYVKFFKDNGLLEYKGSKKTGGYYLTSKMLGLIEEVAHDD